jgi:hypothetical protein
VNSEPRGGPAQAGGPEDPQDLAYRYRDSGIQERRGRVPLWLWALVVGVTIWGIYYVICYWSPPP